MTTLSLMEVRLTDYVADGSERQSAKSNLVEAPIHCWHTRVKQAMGPTRVTATVPTPSHRSKFSALAIKSQRPDWLSVGVSRQPASWV